jgi:hypothetical protein
MAYLAAANALLALCLGLWVRALSRARGQDIPCTSRIFSWGIVAAGVTAIVALVVANVLVLEALDRVFGRKLSPVVFTVWLLAMSAGAILFIVAVNTWHTNRTAAAWIRPGGPGELVVRVGSDTKTLHLLPGSVRVLGIVQGMGGILYVQYTVGPLELVVPFTRDANIEGAAWLDRLRGLVVQGAARTLHRHFAPFR